MSERVLLNLLFDLRFSFTNVFYLVFRQFVKNVFCWFLFKLKTITYIFCWESSKKFFTSSEVCKSFIHLWLTFCSIKKTFNENVRFEVLHSRWHCFLFLRGIVTTIISISSSVNSLTPLKLSFREFAVFLNPRVVVLNCRIVTIISREWSVRSVLSL